MPLTEVNAVRLFWEESGASGVPLVLVHGSWGDHHNWDRVVPSLARRARVSPTIAGDTVRANGRRGRV